MLKKSFQLTDSNATPLQIDDLRLYGSIISTNLAIISDAKQNIAISLAGRNRLVQDILLNGYGYIIEPNDNIMYNEQLNKIMIYTSGTIDDQYNPTE